jgi:hypothetical protein
MRSLVAAGMLGVLALASADAASAVSRGEFIRRGDVVCAQVQRELVPLRSRAAAAARLPDFQKWAAAADLWADQIRIQRRFVARFHAIGVPPNDARARALVAGLDRGVTLAIRVQRVFARRDASALPGALTTYVRFTTDLNRRVRAYGFRVCGR